MKGQILVISGPSGSGKSTLLERLLKDEKDLYFSISSTTRQIRKGEKDGINYHFISKNEFQKGIENGEFLEWAKVHDNFYGTSLKPVNLALNTGKIVIFDIDVQGFNIAKVKFAPLITSVFITTKNQADLKERLECRDADTADATKERIINAREEMEHILEYDYFFINDNLEQSYQNLRCILQTMRLKSANIDLKQIIKKWIN